MTPEAALSTLYASAKKCLEGKMVGGNRWEGELASSALSTATAVIALHCTEPVEHAEWIAGGLDWLIAHQNEDGGWGDTTASFSNISTTLLVRAALKLGRPHALACGKADEWIARSCGSCTAPDVIRTVVARYGKDRTFSVPILMACAIAGMLGEQPRANWQRVLPLPLELAVFPRPWFGALQLPVVSYALPALIAIGRARAVQAPAPWPWRVVRRLVWPRVSRLLEELQPPNGGFLEATPLTSFVTMALASAGEPQHPVAIRGVQFLRNSARKDGSWPIDTCLSTWLTTHAVKAVAAAGEAFALSTREAIGAWLMGQQYRRRHPYTDAAPGGWAWTDLPGGVPDADDTPGALLALWWLSDEGRGEEVREAAELGIRWLLDLQNRDGGIPTFCRGWGALPFDRSSPDLTAHCLRAWAVWKEVVSASLRARIETASRRAVAYLLRVQQADGSWLPLWFGNQHRADEANPTYGTSQVLLALPVTDPAARRGLRWLLDQQNRDGGWGGGEGTPSSIEETSLALEALARFDDVAEEVLERGVIWLQEATRGGTEFPPAPIGFYFAKLWYHEKLYPLIWMVAALGAIKARRNRRVSAGE